MYRPILLCLSYCALSACGESNVATPTDSSGTETQSSAATLSSGVGDTAYAGASIWDGTGDPVQTGKFLIVRDGRVVDVSETIPGGADVIDLQGKWIVPGFVNAHGHVSGRWADDSITNESDQIRSDLALYARYGVTSIVSLGGAGQDTFAVRNDQKDPTLTHARVQFAGAVVAEATSEAAIAAAQGNVKNGVD